MLLLTQKLYKLIPNSYPVVCSDGWLLEVNPNETRINCSNKLCPVDNAMKLDRALDILEVDCKVGPSRALGIIERLGLEHHMDIFNKIDRIYEYEELLTGADITIINAIIDYNDKMKNNPIDLYKFMNCWGLEQLGATNSQKVFNDVDDLEEFYDNIESDICWINKNLSDKLKIDGYSQTIKDIESFLLENKRYILDTASNFKFKKAKKGTVVITITGEISKSKREDGTSYKPRQKFAEEMSDKYGINVLYSNHITQNTNYLICDSDNGHTKINKVKNNPAFKNVEAITSLEFENIMKGMSQNKIRGF